MQIRNHEADDARTLRLTHGLDAPQPAGLEALRRSLDLSLRHDRGLQKYCVDVVRELEGRGLRVLRVYSELELRRSTAAKRRRHYEVSGHWPRPAEVAGIARDFHVGYADKKLRLPDAQIWSQDSSGKIRVENYEYRSGRGSRVSLKVRLGFRLGGLGLGVRQRLSRKAQREGIGRWNSY